MNRVLARELRHGSLRLAALLLPAFLMVACEGGVSGHAPGLAGVQTQDPGTLNFPLAYVKRPPPPSPPTATSDIDVRDLITSTAGGDLYIREQASPGSAETNVTKSITMGQGDVRDLDVSPDGTKLVFSLRLPLNPKKPNTDDSQPTWKIYQYDAVAKTVTQLTNDDTTAGHDVGAHYLPDGRIVFASTRQAATQAILIDEGRPQYPAQTDDRKQAIFLLHVMNADGTNIHQISFNTNHDFAPSVLSNGQIVFSRYESINGDQISLYRCNPDGTNRMLVSWAPCLVENTDGTVSVCSNSNTTGPNVKLAPPQYTVWVYDFDAGTLSPILSAEQGIEIVEPMILQARTPTPTYIPDFQPTTPAEEDLVNNEVGVLNISSVYDYDGVDTAKPSIAAQADPANAAFYARRARFVRIEKAVEIPPKTVRKINQSAFGPAGMGMREILGYAPVQPDGSVQIQVPANVPFLIDVLDANARRISVQHTSWMQVMPGEIKSCNGCHTAGNLTYPSHGRSGLTLAANKGAPTTGAAFPDTNSALFANQGETMAQTLARISCETGSALGNLPEPNTQPCSTIPASDVIYVPIWTVGVTTPRADNYIDLPYGSSVTNATDLGISGAAPTNPNCAIWSAQCRITIHYAATLANVNEQAYIQNVWNAARGPTTNGVANSWTCTNCHNPVNLQNKIQVPAGQLDLTGGAAGPNVVTPDPTLVSSYQNVLSQHFELTLNMGVLQPLTVTDPGPPPTQAPVMLAAPMVAGDAAVSNAFFRMFDGSYKDPVLDHTGFLTIGELRLISEWLDIGGQFYNDPFVAPAM
jgi:Hydrazine synthase alpha subunit middle domain